MNFHFLKCSYFTYITYITIKSALKYLVLDSRQGGIFYIKNNKDALI